MTNRHPAERSLMNYAINNKIDAHSNHNHMPSLLLMCLTTPLLAVAAVVNGAEPIVDGHDYYVIQWPTPGQDETDNMPVGNGRLAANVWVIKDCDLMLYLAHQEAHSELQSLLKLGRMRIHLEPNPFIKGKPFQQTMRLREGRIDIAAGEPKERVQLALLVDKESDVLYVNGTSERPVSVSVSLENWRKERRDTTSATGKWEPNKPNLYCRVGTPPGRAEYWESADVFPACDDGLLWYHRNAYSSVPVHIREQHLQAVADLVPDPLKDNTFGALITGDGLQKKDPFTLVSKQPLTRIEVRVAAHVGQTPTADAWTAAVRQTLARSVDFDVAQGANGPMVAQRSVNGVGSSSMRAANRTPLRPLPSAISVRACCRPWMMVRASRRISRAASIRWTRR